MYREFGRGGTFYQGPREEDEENIRKGNLDWGAPDQRWEVCVCGVGRGLVDARPGPWKNLTVDMTSRRPLTAGTGLPGLTGTQHRQRQGPGMDSDAWNVPCTAPCLPPRGWVDD